MFFAFAPLALRQASASHFNGLSPAVVFVTLRLFVASLLVKSVRTHHFFVKIFGFASEKCFYVVITCCQMVDASVFAQAPLYSSWQIFKKNRGKNEIIAKY